MAETSPPATTNTRFRFLKTLRPAVLIPGIIGGGTMIIIFPAATALLLAYVAVTLTAIAMLAWTGMIAFATAATAALIVPTATVFAVLAIMALVTRIVSARQATKDSLKQNSSPQREGGEIVNALQESLDDWETDGGTALRPPRTFARSRVHRSRVARRRRPA